MLHKRQSSRRGARKRFTGLWRIKGRNDRARAVSIGETPHSFPASVTPNQAAGSRL